MRLILVSMTAALLVGGVVAPTYASSPVLAGAQSEVVAMTDAPQVALEGMLLLSLVEPKGQELLSEIVSDRATSFAVVTDSGTVPITGDLPADAQSGDQFTGTVTVPDAVLEDLSDSAASVVDSSSADEPVAADSAAAIEVIETAAAQSIELPVAGATVMQAAPLPGAPQSHEIKLVVVKPSDAAASTYSDTQLKDLTMSVGGFWGAGMVSNFTTISSVSRFTLAYPCSQDPFARWDMVAQRLGYANASAFVSGATNGTVRHLVVVLPSGCDGKASVGVATLSSAPAQGGLVEFVSGVGVDKQALIHEIGHNLSLGHSNLDLCDKDAVDLGCAEYEYADIYDVMGFSIPGYDAGISTPNSTTQIKLQRHVVLPSYKFSLAPGEQTRTWAVDLERLDAGADYNGAATGSWDSSSFAEVVDPISGETYDLEFRGTEGSRANFWNLQGLSVDGNDISTSWGVRILRENAESGTSALTVWDASLNAYRPWGAVGRPIQNPSGSVSIVVTEMSEGAGAFFNLTLTRPDLTGTAPVFRFWSPQNQSHFYTMSVAERDQIIRDYPSAVWQYEGPMYSAFTSERPGTVPLYRFWSPQNRGHFYTTDIDERDQVIRDYPDYVWTYEGVAFFVYPVDTTAVNTVTVARFWSPTHRHHFYTASANEREVVINDYPDAIWTYEQDNFRVPAG